MRAKLVAVGAVLFVVSAAALPAAQSGQEKVLRPGSGVTDPTLIKQVHPKYTAEAMRAGIQGVVELEAVVLPDGSVGDVRVVKSLDSRYGLDNQAIAAARQWRFEPGRFEDRPVPVMVTLMLEFRQHANRQEPQDDEFTKGAYRLGTPGLFAPKTVRQVVPKYTSGAMRARIQGVVVVEAVVDVDGKVDRVRIKESLDQEYGLDYAALDAARQWEFQPGTLDGKPAPVLITFTLEFRLHE